ncbi:MAG: vitamin K epoxide reductase family protein [Candidatus Eremiobacteraeota bacterium]|nr:vitamin K epoxide reductase family protein [Candidatus Eremiobacteraeota bacterium]MBV9737924.1 vitamin K epoxide reductase family protein [Candidatus Eremiobacteraeota bacterium]
MALLILKIVVDLLCALGFYVSVHMYRRSILAEAGKVKGKSVVKSPAARLFFGVPNSLWGMIFYVAIGVLIWFSRGQLVWTLIFVAAGAAALTSLYLAYRLIFVSKTVCPYCWTSHAVNWALVILSITINRFH